jgi:Family of unknown function (DUF6493)
VTEWAELRQLIDRRQQRAVASVLRDLGPEQRRELAGPLGRYERELRADLAEWWPRQPALAIAGAAILPSASALAPWLARNSLIYPDPDGRGPRNPATDIVVDALRAREVPWLGDLARRLAERLSARVVDTDLWRLISELVTLTGIDPPTSDGFVLGWAEQHRGIERAVVGDIRRDPRLAALILRLFDSESLSAEFGWPESQWPPTLVMLAAEGLVDRAVLLDSCLAALQRGGRLGAARGLLRVHEELAPTVSEVASRAGDYVALLPDSPSIVAAMAQRELRRLDETGQLAPGTLCQLGRAVLLRTEKKLVRAQLGWLDAAAKRDPGHAAEIVLAMATAFGQHAADIQRQALTLTTKHVSRLDTAARTELAEAARALPADLRGEAAEAFGGLPAASAEQAPQMLPSAAPAGMPPPIGSPAELAAEIASLFTQFSEYSDEMDPADVERVLAGIVAVSCGDRSALAAALGRFLARHPYVTPGEPVRVPEQAWFLNEFGELEAIIGAALVPARRPPGSRYPAVGEVPNEAKWQVYLRDARLPEAQAGLLRRFHEIAVGIAYAPRPLLMSTPTSSNGLIDPAELVKRMRRAAAEGWQPWELDLTQALLRLPRDPDPAAAADARTIGTPAAAMLAVRLSAGSPADPLVTSEPRTIRFPQPYPGHGFITEERELAIVCSRSPGQPGDPSTLVGDLRAPERWHGYDYTGRTCWMSCWPLMLPVHRDVAAAHLVPHLSTWMWRSRGGKKLLPVLAATDGPVGGGTHLAVAYGLAARDRADRAAAVDAMIALASRGQLDGSALGEHLGTLAAHGSLLLNRVVPGLREVAEAGASSEVWALTAAALPRTLPPATERAPHQLAALIELGVDLAGVCRPGTTLLCLDLVAAQHGSSQLVTQARRLREALRTTARR